MPLKANIDAFEKSLVGISGTYLSIVLEAISTIGSIGVAVLTGLYIYQQLKNAKAKGKAFNEDRENEKNDNENS